MNEQEYNNEVKKIDEQIKNLRKQKNVQIKNLERKKEEMQKQLEDEKREREFKIYKTCYDALHGWFTQNGITDDMIFEMDGKTQLRQRLFGVPTQNQQ